MKLYFTFFIPYIYLKPDCQKCLAASSKSLLDSSRVFDGFCLVLFLFVVVTVYFEIGSSLELAI